MGSGMRKSTTGSKGTRGQVVVLAAACLVILVGAAAFCIDVGYMCCARARLQNAADAGALAAMEELVEERFGGASESAARLAGVAEAASLVEANWWAARCEVTFGAFTDGQFVAQTEGSTASAALVRAVRDPDAPGGSLALFFSPVLGRDTVDVQARAVSEVRTDIKGMSAGLAPFSIPEEAIAGAVEGEKLVFYLPHGDWTPLADDDFYAPGNFGWLNLDGGAQPTGELIDWILNGYNEVFTIEDPETGLWLDGTCGVRASLQDELETRIGDEMIILVHDQVIEQGANADFHIVAFAAVTLLEVELTGGEKYIAVQLNLLTNTSEAIYGGEPGDGNVGKIVLAQ